MCIEGALNTTTVDVGATRGRLLDAAGTRG
jgi:hypothetical protein